MHLSTHRAFVRQASSFTVPYSVFLPRAPSYRCYSMGLNPFPVLCRLTKASILKIVRLQVDKNLTQLYQHDFREKRAWELARQESFKSRQAGNTLLSTSPSRWEEGKE